MNNETRLIGCRYVTQAVLDNGDRCESVEPKAEVEPEKAGSRVRNWNEMPRGPCFGGITLMRVPNGLVRTVYPCSATFVDALRSWAHVHVSRDSWVVHSSDETPLYVIMKRYHGWVSYACMESPEEPACGRMFASETTNDRWASLVAYEESELKRLDVAQA